MGLFFSCNKKSFGGKFGEQLKQCQDCNSLDISIMLPRWEPLQQYSDQKEGASKRCSKSHILRIVYLVFLISWEKKNLGNFSEFCLMDSFRSHALHPSWILRMNIFCFPSSIMPHIAHFIFHTDFLSGQPDIFQMTNPFSTDLFTDVFFFLE